MLDARSFEALRGEDREKAQFLCELCWTPAIDALWSWEGSPISTGIPVTELQPIRNDDRAVSRVGERPGGFIGGIPCWSQFERQAANEDLDTIDRAWFLYYAPLAHFSDRSGRHFLVTADKRLLTESRGEKGWFRKGRYRITSIDRALQLAGNAMKAHGEVFYESPQPQHTVHTTANSMYDYLGRFLISSRRRLFMALMRDGETKDDFHSTSREALCVSIFDRAADLLRGRDRIALADLRFDDSGVLDGILYDLRATISNSAGLFDTVAVLAESTFDIHMKHISEVSLNEYSFRKALRETGNLALAKQAETHCPLMAFVWSLRNPILHRGGMTGYQLHALGVGKSVKATLTEDQAEKLKSLCGHRHESLENWGLDKPFPGLEPSVDPATFSFRLVVVTLQATDQLLSALADDREVPNLETSWTAEERKAIQRFRWLSGIPEFESAGAS